MVAPGTVISPALAFVPMTDEEMAAEDAAPPSPEGEELYDPGSPQTFKIHPMFCAWGTCTEGFWELEDMVQHLHDAHINPQGSKKPTCEWLDCPRKGKPQTSKFALLAHLRSHTGEKPFVCPRPECDKSFTRTDALQKHMRVQHQENLPPTRKPPTKKPKLETELEGTETIVPEPPSNHDTTPTANVADVFAPFLDSSHFLFDDILDSATVFYDPALLATGTPIPSAPIASGSATPRITTPLQVSLPPSAQPLAASATQTSDPDSLQAQESACSAPHEEDEEDSPEMARAVSTNSNLLPDHVRYLCMLGRHKAAYDERDTLNAELARLQKKRDAIFEEKEGMLNTIFHAELGEEAQVVIKTIEAGDVPPLVWSLSNRTSLPNIGKREVKDDGRNRGVGDDDDD